VDHNADRVQKFSSDGAFLLTWGVLGTSPATSRIRGGCHQQNEQVYVTSNFLAQEFTREGAFVTRWGEYGYGESEFINPTDVVVGLDGRVYIVDSYQHMVQCFGYVTTATRGWSWGRIKALYR
jgi:hypothetical protein